MAIKLPQQLSFVEYKPSMVGIPTQAVGRLYDRLDAEAIRTRAAASKTQEMLAQQIAAANEGDKAFLIDLQNKLDGVFDAAKEENNLPGHARQIKNLVSDIAGDNVYQSVLRNSKLKEESRARESQLAAQYGIENVVNAGDDGETFSTVGPDGEVREFQSLVQRRPDYLKGMDEVFMKNVDIVSSMADLEQFVYGNPDDEMPALGALEAYKNTPAGRVHVNDLARQRFGAQFSRLPQEQQVEVLNQLNEELFNAGKRFIKTNSGSTSGLSEQAIKDLKGKGILTSGKANITLTDGTKANDQTVQVYDDQLTGSVMDNQLKMLFESDPTINFLIDSGDGQLKRTDAKMQLDDISDVRLTSGVGPNGLPLVQINYKQLGTDGQAGVGYAEIPENDLVSVLDQMGAGLNYQLANYTRPGAREAFAPTLVNLYDHKINLWQKDSKAVEDYTSITGITVRKQGNKYALYNKDGNLLYNRSNDLPHVYENFENVREVLGHYMLNITT